MVAPLKTRVEHSEMRVAAFVSGGAHVAIVVIAAVAGQLFTSEQTAEFQVADVSLVPASSFDADISDQLVAAPETAPEPSDAPDVSATPDQIAPPESPPPPPSPRPAQQSAPPEPTETPEDVAALAAPPAPDAPTPPDPVEAAQPPQPATPEPPAQPETAAVPEPTPEPTPEPDPEPEPERVAAPPPPRPRPQRVVTAAEAEPDPEPEPTPTETAETPTEQPSRPTAPAQAPVRTGPPLTFSEKDGIRFAIQRCWSVPVGLEAAENLSVTLGVSLSRDGRIVAGPALVEPTGALSRSHKVAYGAARRAILRCAPYTEFPPDKYAQWRELEVTFNPKEMVIQ